MVVVVVVVVVMEGGVDIATRYVVCAIANLGP
jgi:hypothetical protein